MRNANESWISRCLLFYCCKNSFEWVPATCVCTGWASEQQADSLITMWSWKSSCSRAGEERKPKSLSSQVSLVFIYSWFFSLPPRPLTTVLFLVIRKQIHNSAFPLYSLRCLAMLSSIVFSHKLFQPFLFPGFYNCLAKMKEERDLLASCNTQKTQEWNVDWVSSQALGFLECSGFCWAWWHFIVSKAILKKSIPDIFWVTSIT